MEEVAKISKFQKILRASINRGFLEVIRDKIDKSIRSICVSIVRLSTKINCKKIVFLSFSGNYDCNTKAIAQEILDRNLDMELYWGAYSAEQSLYGGFPNKINVFERETYDCYKHLASAKVIIDNSINLAMLGYKKKKGQILIETWHGSIGIKKFGRAGNNDRFWQKRAKKEGRQTDYIISNSVFENNVYTSEFWKKTNIWQFGHPRNDILLSASTERTEGILKDIRKRYGIADTQKICLYAPTFRDDNNLNVYDIDYARLKDALKTRFGGDWAILVRFHNNTCVRNASIKSFIKQNYIINVSDYPDISELLAGIDVGITDYSSWICEYMLTRKPGFIFALDAKHYTEKERKVFFSLEELPFPYALDMETLVDNILSFDEALYKKKCNEFLSVNGSFDDGNASKRTVDQIIKTMGQ